MKILNITSITELRGGDVQMYTVYNLLKDKNELTQYILCPDDSIMAQMCKRDAANYFTYKKNKLKLFNLIVAIVKICKKESISILHIHDSTALNAGLMALKFIRKNTPSLILSRKRNNKIKNTFFSKYKYSHPDITNIISVSKAVETIFETILPKKEHLITIYDAIDVKKFSAKINKNLLHTEFQLAPETKIIGNIAGLTNQKDIFTFMDSAKKIKEKNNNKIPLKFFIIGDGALKNELITYSKLKGLENDVIFTGFRNDVPDLLPEFNVFLITSLTEGLPLTIYEAMACKIPIVATAAGGIPEVILNEETGFVCALKDSDMLSERVLQILNDKEITEKIKNNAFELVRKKHDLSVMKKNYYKFYSSLET